MKSSNTAERLKYLMAERQLRQVDILRAIEPYCKKYGVKLERNALSQYVSGKAIPRQDKLTVLGLGLDVSEAWLMGYDVPIERDPPPVVEEAEAEAIARRILNLSPDNRVRILERLQVLEEEEQAVRDVHE